MKRIYTRGQGIALLTLFLINLTLIGLNFAPVTQDQNNLSTNGNTNQLNPLVRKDVPAPLPGEFEQVNSWWNESFRYRVEVNIQEPGISARSNEPVSVWLSFSLGTCSNYSIRVVPGGDPQQAQSDIVSQLYNITYTAPDHYFILSCTISFEVSIPQSSNVNFFVYYTDNAVEDRSTYYLNQPGAVQTTFDGSSSVTLSNGQIELRFANQSNEYSLKLLARPATNYGSQYALSPSSMPLSTTVANAPTFFNPNTNGFVMNWLMIGPFTETTIWGNFFTIQNPALSQTGPGGFNSHNFVDTKKSYIAGDVANGKTWTMKTSNDGTGLCDLNSLIQNVQYVDAYALAYIYFPTVSGNIYAMVSSDDGYGLWINGIQVAYNHILRGVTGTDQEAVQVNAYLHQGWNRVLFLCEEFTGAWSMRLRFATTAALQSTSVSTNVLLNLKVAYAPIGFIDTQAGSIEEGENGLSGPVFTQFNYHVAQTEDMVVNDNVTFYQSLNMFKVQRMFYFTSIRTTGNNTFGLFNDFIPNPSGTFSEYIYDGQTISGLGSAIYPQNYTLVRNRNGGDFLTTTGSFITNISKGNGATTLSSLQWQVTYLNNIVQLMPGRTTDLNNIAGTSDNYFVVTFWKFLDQNFGQQLQDATSLAEQIYKDLKNPLIVTPYPSNVESLFFNLNVECKDIDGNPAQGVTVTLVNSTDNVNGWNYVNPTPINGTSGTDGIAHFIRLQRGNYTANMTYTAYGFPPISVNPSGIMWGAGNITVNTTQDILFPDISLTDLRLTFIQFDPTPPGTEKGPIQGGTVSFYTNWSSQAPTHITDLVTDNNGFVDFYWHNYTADIANTTFTMNFLGAPRQLNFTNVGVTPYSDSLNVTMNSAASYTVDVQIGDFSTNLEVISSSLVNTHFWGDPLPISVNYTYSVLGTTNQISGAIVTYKLFLASTGALINESSFIETSPGSGIYNFTLDSSALWLGLQALTSYQMEVFATKTGFTPRTGSILISLNPISTSLTSELGSVDTTWNDNFTVRCYYNDTLSNSPLTGASITYQATSIPSINGPLIEEGNGWYNFTLNTTAFVFADSYTMSITASKLNFQTTATLIIVHIAKIQTYVADWINPARQKITIQDVVNQYVTTSLIMTFNYTQADGTGIDNATTASYEWQDEIGSLGSGFLVFEGNGIYSLDFNTANLPIMQYSLVIHLGKQNYVERQAAVTLNIIAIPGVAATSDLVLTRTQRSPTVYSFILTDGRAGHTTEIYPQASTNVQVDFTSTSTFNKSFLSWLNGTGDGVFNLSVDTRDIPADTYVLRVTFSRTNYTDVVASLTLTVSKFQPSVSIPTGVVTFVEGTTVTIDISVTDGLLAQVFEGVNIRWDVEGTSLGGNINTVDPSGNYKITIAPENLTPDTDYNMTISIQVTIGGVTYNVTTAQLVNFRVNYSQILGIPRPYFWYMVFAIAVAVGVFAVYRSIKYARIPQFVKDINATRSTIRKGKGVGRGSIAESRSASIANALENRYTAIGASAAEKFVPKAPTTKEEGKGERKPEEEVA